MDLQFVCVLDPWYVPGVVMFCALWPLVAMRFIARGERSASPIGAIIVPIALVQALIWYELADLVTWLTWQGTFVPDSYPIARILAWPAFWIAVIALARRHRPVPDTMVLALSVLLLGSAIAVRLFGASVTVQPRFEYVYIARAGAVAALAIAGAAFVRLARGHRMRRADG